MKTTNQVLNLYASKYQFISVRVNLRAALIFSCLAALLGVHACDCSVLAPQNSKSIIIAKKLSSALINTSVVWLRLYASTNVSLNCQVIK